MEAENKTAKQAPRVTKAEVIKWENDFRENVSPLVKFDTQDNGFSMKFYNGESGVDAYWSGTIILKSDNYLKWNFSMLNGVFVESKINLDENNHKIPSNLYDFFVGWQGEVSKAITEPGAEEQANQEANNPPEQTPDLVGPESNNVPEAPIQGPPPMTEGVILSNTISKNSANNPSRINTNRKNNIMDSAERMRRLAGL
jgi:hypothetical protein